MALLTVLSKSLYDTPAKASAVFDHLVGEPLTVVMAVLGTSSETPEILQAAVGRAEAYPNVRRVVHIVAEDVLEDRHVKEIQGDDDAHVSAFYGLKDAVAARLDATDSADRFEVEKAFLKAEKQGLR